MEPTTQVGERTLDQAEWRNSFVEELPGDASGLLRPRQVPGACYSLVQPTPVAAPRLLAWSQDLGSYLGLEEPDTEGPVVDLLAGNRVLPAMKPFAARYGGHQFGGWAGQLGDGRALSLGEVTARDGSQWEIQLKGAGMTPYSRRGDGRAVLRSSLREFLCSEAMHWLGVPTTRALSLVSTGDRVVRDMFYDGRPQYEPGAIVARVAPTFIRFGNFEMMTSAGEMENLRALADYVLRHHYPELGPPGEAAYSQWFREVCRRTAVMVSHWMTVGFVHGVMNTDNMSILGLTIDYGPYGWLEPFEPDWTPNTTDFGQRRYAFGQQPQIGMWNLSMLARALMPLVPEASLIEGLELYRATYIQRYRTRMLRKLGLHPTLPEADGALLDHWETAMAASGVDLTLFFRHLSHAAPALLRDRASLEGVIEASAYQEAQRDYAPLTHWLEQYGTRLQQEAPSPNELERGMLAANPRYVLRNYLAQEAIEAAEQNNLAPLHRLLHVLQHPYDEQPEHADLARKRPEWARERPGCATLSCSS